LNRHRLPSEAVDLAVPRAALLTPSSLESKPRWFTGWDAARPRVRCCPCRWRCIVTKAATIGLPRKSREMSGRSWRLLPPPDGSPHRLARYLPARTPTPWTVAVEKRRWTADPS